MAKLVNLSQLVLAVPGLDTDDLMMESLELWSHTCPFNSSNWEKCECSFPLEVAHPHFSQVCLRPRCKTWVGSLGFWRWLNTLEGRTQDETLHGHVGITFLPLIWMTPCKNIGALFLRYRKKSKSPYHCLLSFKTGSSQMQLFSEYQT